MTQRVLRFLPRLLLVAVLGGCARDTGAGETHQPVVAQLIALLDHRPELREALIQAIDSAHVQGIPDLDAFYARVDTLVTWIPDERVAVPKVLGIHYIINQATGDVLNRDAAFSDWLHGVATAWGKFLDSPASVPGIASFASQPDYHMEDYVEGPSGWQTFNQFFARELRPGLRPIASPGDDAVIVAPADAIFMGAHPIDARSTITVKGAEWRIADLLDGSPYAAAFANGIYAHTFLRITDYHRFHAPVGGVIREVRHVHGRVYIDVVRNPDGSLSGANGDSYQFNQERGLMIIESPTVGLVAMVPVGMTLISSVTMTPTVGAEVRKGEQLGWFQFGGSDIVLLFQNRNIHLEAEPGQRYKMGERIGSVGR